MSKPIFLRLAVTPLLAAKLIYRVYEDFGVNVDLRTFFEARTVAMLAAVVEEQLLLTMEPEDLTVLGEVSS